MVQLIYTVIQSQRSYNTLELKIVEKLNGLEELYRIVLDRTLYEPSKVESIKSVEFVVQKVL